MPKKKKSKIIHRRTQTIHKTAKPTGLSLKHLYYFLGFTVIALILVSQITYTQILSSPSVLGDDSSLSGSGRSNGGGGSSGGGPGSGGTITTIEQHPTQSPEIHPSGPQGQNPVGVNVQKNETEIQLSNGTTINTKVEDNGSGKVEIVRPGIQFKFETHNNKTQLEAVNDHGEKVSTADAEIKRLEKDLETKDISISSEDGELEVSHNGVRARTDFPLSIDPITNQLVITTPQGQKIVAVLPDDAIKNMLAGGYLTTIASNSADIQGASGSGVISGSYLLSLHNGTVVYEVQGEKTQKFLGLFTVTTPKTVLVSAQNGQAVEQSQSWLATLISFLSF